MWRRFAYWSGVALIVVALAAMPSAPIIESYVGGSSVHGRIEDGRYFVDPKHGKPIVEVSESTWRTVWWIERLWPFSAWVPGLLGMFLVSYGMGPNLKPLPDPPAEPPPWVMQLYLAGTAFIVGGTATFWFIFRIPWATMLVGWLLFCISVATIAWLHYRSFREQQVGKKRD
jgi:hypothetical protein